MGKQQADDLTGAHNPRVLKAISLIGQGLVDLAEALAAPSASEPRPRPAAASSPDTAPPPAEEQPVDHEAQEDEDGDIELADLQKLAKDLIKAGGRPKLLKILEELKLENVSSAP